MCQYMQCVQRSVKCFFSATNSLNEWLKEKRDVVCLKLNFNKNLQLVKINCSLMFACKTYCQYRLLS